MAEIQDILNEVKSRSMSAYGNRLNKIILYGSYARGEASDQSDIDIMIILSCPKDEIKLFRNDAIQMASDISLDSEKFISILLRDKKSFEENADFLPFYKNIVNEGVYVYGNASA